jgi:hypothetical protein
MNTRSTTSRSALYTSFNAVRKTYAALGLGVDASRTTLAATPIPGHCRQTAASSLL